jgi:hypothetical protein
MLDSIKWWFLGVEKLSFETSHNICLKKNLLVVLLVSLILYQHKPLSFHLVGFNLPLQSTQTIALL